MRLLANENFAGAAVKALRDRGHDVVWIREDSPGISDSEVLSHAVRLANRLAPFIGAPFIGVEDLAGRRLEYGYVGDHLVSAKNLASKIHTFAYDVDGNMVSHTDPEGNVHSYSYDARDRCYRYVDPEGHVERYAYLDSTGTTARTVVAADRRGFDTPGETCGRL